MMRTKTPLLAVALTAVALLAGGCGGAKSTSSPPAGGSSSTADAGKGFKLAFTTNGSCDSPVAVAGGFFGFCQTSDENSGTGTYQFYSSKGESTPFTAARMNTDERLFVDGSGKLVVTTGQLRLDDPLSATKLGPDQLLVIDPTKGTIRKAIPFPTASSSDSNTYSSLVAVVGSTAVVSSTPQVPGGDPLPRRLSAYDLDGTKRWDVQASADRVRPVKDGIVFVSSPEVPYNETPPGYDVARLRIADGSVMWKSSRHASNEIYVGENIFYDGPVSLKTSALPPGVWSLTTGTPVAATGPKADVAAPPQPMWVLFKDDKILTDPLRRVTASGEERWSLPGSMNAVRALDTDGQLLVARGNEDLVVLDPNTGNTTARAPKGCAKSVTVLGGFVLTDGCQPFQTQVYSVKGL